MKKILIAGAGGAPSEGVIRSLQLSHKKDCVIGMGSEPTDLALSKAERKYWVPYANHPEYPAQLFKLIEKEKPDLIHFQNDLEVFHGSLLRDELHKRGVQTFMPTHDVIETCVDKFKTYRKLKQAGVPVPKNILLNSEDDLKNAFDELADEQGKIWLRASSIGAGGKGALPTNNFEFAKNWIDHFKGWGDFCAAQMLTSQSVTWLSIWHEGKLVVAQTRIRKGWVHGNRTLSGVTGVTKVGQTYSNQLVDETATKTILAIDQQPHGIYAVDMTYDKNNIPNPTEINISRFFTTVLFFTKAGLNLPSIFANIVLHHEWPELPKKINPLPDGLLWLRGMDTEPVLVHESEMNNLITLL
ncbi:MAG: ATP-grasp domain-containing protein [Cyclobacteriaceae bacterium]|jgi:hypothetical protein|nr:ATP-grasp domain-containing protein [Flammeovirgaceae bacterium]MCZ8021386.1 ATP-grasp domain-containing protein [Cytophagales bacterium]MCZ8327966.1 ATP-grasp domain-containing protein [Cyclobacteriaceae bacterium]